MTLICAVFFLIFIAFCESDNGKVEDNFEDAKEILLGRRYYWKNWRFHLENEGYTSDMYVWSEAVALKYWMHSHGCLMFIIDHKLWRMCWDEELHNFSDSDYQYTLHTFRRTNNNSTTQAQPILSHSGSTKLVFGDWFLVSRKEGEISIEHGNAHLVITIREDFPGFTVEFNDTKQTFTANTLLGAEFSTSRIPGRKINQSSFRAEAHKSETEPQSNLTSCCTLNRNHSDNGWTEIQCQTNARLHNISYVWNINRFDLHRPADKMERKIRSSLFSSDTYDRIKWYLEITPRNKTSDNISLFLHRSSNCTETQTLAYLSIDFLDSKGNLLHTLTFDWFKTYCEKVGLSWGWYEIPVNKVVSFDNSVNIVCKMAVCEFTTTAFHPNRTNLRINPEYNFSQNITHSSIKNADDPDIVLVLSNTGKEYPANKSVLAASSPVFATMFNTGRTKKGEEIGRVNITDVDSELVMDELLKYIETSKCENIETLAHDLLVAAHKFKLDNLTELCIEKITNNLTVGNAVDTLNLADKHGFDKLKSKTIRFIAANYAQVSNTSDWKQMEKAKNNEFVHEVCKMLSNNSSNKEIAEV